LAQLAHHAIARATRHFAIAAWSVHPAPVATSSDPRDVLFNLRALAALLKRRGIVTWQEAEPRGRKGPDRSRRRTVMLTIDDPAAFDHLRWQLYRAGVGARTTDEARARESR